MSFSYELIDGQTGQVVDTFTSLRVACSAADDRNRKCGSHRYTVEAVLA